MQYIKAEFGRGQGLCNRLFPLCRAIVYQHLYGGFILYPHLMNIRTAPFRMGGISYKKSLRKILLIDNFSFTNAKYLNSLQSLLIEKKQLPHINYTNAKIIHQNQLDCLISFNGQHVFTGLYQHRELIRNELLAITKTKWQLFINNIPEYGIGMNIRLGNDFKNAQSKNDYYTKGAIKTPLCWFVQTLLDIRNELGFNIEAKIVTDGTKEQLQPLLALPNVELLETPCAMTDLYALSKCSLLLGSGGSSFSAWASFLGKIPTLTIEGQHLNWFKVSENTDDHWIETYNHENRDPNVIAYIAHIIKKEKRTI